MTDTKKFDKLYKDNFNLVFHYALDYIRDYDLAKDVSQDVFLDLWNTLDKVKEDKERSYLLTITRNKCLNLIRHNKIQIKYYKHKEIIDFNMMLNFSALETTSNYIYEKEVNILIDSVINKMPKFLSSTFYLSRITQLKNEEIAKKQNVSIRTVEYRLKKALLLVNMVLRDYRTR